MLLNIHLLTIWIWKGIIGATPTSTKKTIGDLQYMTVKFVLSDSDIERHKLTQALNVVDLMPSHIQFDSGHH